MHDHTILDQKIRGGDNLVAMIKSPDKLIWATIVVDGQEYEGVGPSLDIALTDLNEALREWGA